MRLIFAKNLRTN